MSISRHLLLMSFCVCLPIVFFASYMTIVHIEDTRSATNDNALAIATTIRQTLDGELLATIVGMKVLAADRNLAGETGVEDLREFYDEAIDFTRDRGAGIALIERDGTEVFNTRKPLGTPLPKTNALDAVSRVFATGQPVITDVFVGAVFREALVTIEVPVIRDGRVRRVLTTILLADDIRKLVTQASRPDGWGLAVLDSQGRFVARSRAAAVGELARPGLPEAVAAHTEGWVDTVTREGIPVSNVLVRSKVSPWTVVVGVPRDELLRPLTRMVVVLAAAAATTLFVAAAMAAVFGRRIVGAIGRLCDDAGVAAVSGIVEIDAVARRLREGRAELRESESKLRLFVEHAPIALAMLDTGMRYVFTSRLWATHCGSQTEDIVGKSHYEVIPEIPERWREIHRRCLAGETIRCEEDPFPRADGHLDWVRWEIRPWYKDGDSIGGIVIMTEDVTEKKRDAEELARHRLHLEEMVAERTAELRESNRLIEERAAEIADLYDNAPCGYHSLDRNGTIVRMNDTELAWLGYERDEVVGRLRFADLLDVEGVARHKRNLPEFLAKGSLRDLEYDLKAKDGRTIPVLVSATTVRDQSGAFRMSRVAVYNLTERKQAEAAVRESEIKYRMLFDRSPDGILLIDPEGMRLIEFNGSAHQQLGYEREEFAALRLPDISAENSEDGIRRLAQRISCEGGYDFETLHRTRGGEIRNMLISVRPMEYRGRIVHHAIWRDITDIRRAQRVIEENERRLLEITTALGEGLYVMDEQGRIVFTNPAASRMLGWSEEEMLGTSGNNLIHARRSDDSLHPIEECEISRAHSADRMLTDHEDTFWTRDGRPFPVSVTLTMSRSDDGASRAVILFQDITERKRTEAELQGYRDGLEALVEERTSALTESNRQLAIARDRAEEANHAKSAFLANMSHELRTPLSAILGFSQLLEMDADQTAMHRQCLGHILKSGRHLLALINDLLDLAKIEVGQVSIVPDVVIVADLLADFDAAIRSMADASDVTVNIGADERLPDVRADRTRLNQALLNLGTNAIKYNRPGGRVDVTCMRASPHMVRLEVTDTGHGIPEGRQSELFEPFNRLGREGGGIEGTGIGLALSRKLMRMMGGDIGFTNRPGGGSIFRIDIPVHRPDAVCGEAEEVPSGSPLSIADMGDRTVLCVDDSASGRELVAMVTAKMPRVLLLTATTAEEGIEAARRHRPDLILMDINLPGMDGISALAELRRHQETRDIPVFALSAAAIADEIDRGLAAGFERYLTKPLDIRFFMTVLADRLVIRD